MTQYHANGRENSVNCARFPHLLEERAGVRASVSSNPIFGVRGSLLKIRNGKSEIRNQSEPPYVGCYGSRVQSVTQCRIHCPPLADFLVGVLVFAKRSVSRYWPSSRSWFSPGAGRASLRLPERLSPPAVPILF